MQKGCKLCAGDALAEETTRRATRSALLKEVTQTLEATLNVLNSERKAHEATDQELEQLKEETGVYQEELDAQKEMLRETQIILTDVTKASNKHEKRKDILEKHLWASNARNNRLKENKNVLTELNKNKLEEQERLTSLLTIAEGKIELTRQTHCYEMHALHANIGVLQSQLLEEKKGHTEAQELLTLKICELKQLHNQLDEYKIKVERLTRRLDATRRARKSLVSSLCRLEKQVDALQTYHDSVNKTLVFLEKGTYTPCVHTFVRQIVIKGCPMAAVGSIINEFYLLMIKPILDPKKWPESIHPDTRTTASIISEAGVAADIQSALEVVGSSGEYIQNF